MSRIPSMLFVFFALLVSARADQVVLENGDRLTGTIIKSDAKTLTLKSEFVGTVTIQWSAVASFKSDQPMHVTLKGGQVLVGAPAVEAGKLEVKTKDAGVVTSAKDSVETMRDAAEQAAYEQSIERLRNPGLLDLWSGYFDTGLATSRGNAKTTTFNMGFNAARATTRDKISFNFTSLYNTNSTTGTRVTTANLIRGGLRYDINIRPNWFGFGSSDFEFDEFQKLDLRFAPSGGMGYKVFKTKAGSFMDVYGGAGANKEFFSTGLRRTSAEALMGNELVYKVSEALELQQKFSFFSNLSDTGSYRMNFDAGAAAKLNRWLSWQVHMSDRFLSNPVPGAVKNDVLLTTGVRFTFARADEKK